MLKENIQFIYFDLGNVLFKVDHCRAWENTRKYSSLSTQELYERFYGAGEMIEHMTGNLSDDEFFSQLKSLLEFEKSVAHLKTIWEDVFLPIEERLKTISKIAAIIPTGVLSNISPVHSRFLEKKHAQMQKFSHKVYSWETGFMKPRKEIFAQATRLCGFSPPNCLFVDDQEQHTRAASQLGWKTLMLSLDDCLETRLGSIVESFSVSS